MNKYLLSTILLSCSIVTVSMFGSGCKKTTIREVTNVTTILRDTFRKEYSKDSITIIKGLIVGLWQVQANRIETYSGATVTDVRWDFLAGTNTTNEFKADKSYVFFYRNAPAGTGTWDIVAPGMLVQDKGVAGQERYYHIITIDRKVLLTRGPFKADGTAYSPNNLYNFYIQR